MTWVNAVVQGVLLGGLYALLAAGLSLMFGVMRIVNLAHGTLAVLASYIALVVVQRAGVSPFVALLVVVPAMALIGYVVQLGIFNRTLELGGLAPLLAAFGIAVVLTQLLQLGFSSDSRSLPTGGLSVASVRLTPQIALGVLPLLIFGVGVVVLLALQFLLSRTALGRAMRAASDDPQTVPLMGLDNRRIYAAAAAIALGVAGVAGVLLGTRGNFDPNYGQAMLIFAFEAVIIGGLGSLWGTAVGGIVLAVAQTVGSQVDPSLGVLVGHLVFLAVLVLRPTGLFPKAVSA